jgi:methylenetetrahydrofolate--tRNA-(uracil-5-)-methyltransferase
MNINYGLLPGADSDAEFDANGKKLKAKERGANRKRTVSRRALADLEIWLRCTARAAAE